MLFSIKGQDVVLVTGFNQYSRFDNLISGLFNHIVDMASNDETNYNSDDDEEDEFLFGSDAELARIVGISVFHGSFPFFLWVLPDFSVYLRCLKLCKARSLTLHISKQNKYK